MRYVLVPEELRGYSPIWVSGSSLSKIKVINGYVCYGDMSVAALYIDVTWLDIDSVTELLRIVNSGGNIILKDKPRQPGFIPSDTYNIFISDLIKHPNTHKDFDTITVAPIIEGSDMPPFWCREDDTNMYIFLAHPATSSVKYPLRYQQHKESDHEEREIKVYSPWRSMNLNVKFAPGDCIMLHITSDGTISSLPVGNIFK